MTKQIQDRLNRKLHFKNTPKRIISLVPSQTELLVDLGLEDNIVGITKFCVHPNHLKKTKSIVGGTKQIHIEKIKKLIPDIILCNKEENTKDIVEVCEKVCNVHVSDIFNIDDSIALINQYGVIFNKKEAALKIVNKIFKELNDFESFINEKSVLKVAYFIWKTPWIVAANNTFINYILGLNRFENFYKGEHRYPEITLDNATIVTNVDVVLLSSEPYPFKENHVKEVQVYYPKTNVVLVDGELFSWYGSRLIKAFKYFKNLRLNLEKMNQPY